VGEVNSEDPFVSTELEIEVDAETSRILDRRIRTAADGHLVSEEEARHRIKRWISPAGRPAAQDA